MGLDLGEGGEDGGEGVVDPHVDGVRKLLGSGGCVLDLVVSHVGGNHQRRAAGGFDVPGGGVQPTVPRARSATFAPRLARRRAVPRPMPPLAPVMTTT